VFDLSLGPLCCVMDALRTMLFMLLNLSFTVGRRIDGF
jgi:hypothetical protein